MPFTDSELDTLVVINVTCSIFSLCGSLTIIICFLYFEDLRTFAFRLVFFISCSDACACIFRLFGNPRSDEWCQLQAFGSNIFDLASFMWAAAIAVVINIVRVKYDNFPAEKFMLWCHFLIWPSSLVISILPFFSGSYGPAGGWCWIKDYDTWDKVWRIVCFYIILLAIFCYLVYVYFRLYRYLTTGDEISEDSKAMLRKVFYFPLVLFVCYFFAFVRRLLEVLGNLTTPYWLAILHITFSSLLGLGNAIVYGAINSMMRQQIMNKCCGAKNVSESEKRSKDSIIQMEGAKEDGPTRKSTHDFGVDLAIDE